MNLLFFVAGILSTNALRVEPDALCCGWTSSPLESAPEDGVSVTFHLKETNSALVQEMALSVSDPSSSMYGAHLNLEDIYALTRPAKEDIDTVTSWLTAYDIPFTVVHDRRVHVSMSMDVAAQLFDTEFVVLSHAGLNVSVTRAGAYTLPAGVDAATAAVFGLHGLPIPTRGPVAVSKEVVKVTPDVLATSYDITGAPTPSGSDKNHQAVAEFQGQTMKEKDLVEFFQKYVKNAKAGDDKVAKFVGDKNKEEPQDEASLDIQYIMGNTAGLKTEFWLFNNMDFCGDLEKWTALILETKEAPLVHSVSYGWQGELSRIQCSEAKVKVVDDNFAKLAAMGITILFASGDSGSGYDPSTQCGGKFKKGKAFNGTVLKELKDTYDAGECCESAAEYNKAEGWTYHKHSELGKPGKCILFHKITGTTEETKAESDRLANGAKLHPSWPASSPWVTSVGATRFIGQKVGNEQMASDQFGSGGGFSTMFNRSLASWQESVVTAYLADAPGLPPNGSFPPGGRATPDVSALGEGYMTIIGGRAQPIGGTSASTPFFAGLVSLLNEARQQKDGKPMGFLNPWLYQHPEAFTDITKGSNKIGRGEFKLKYGFNCTKGWDPVTGLGTPIFSKMLAAALN